MVLLSPPAAARGFVEQKRIDLIPQGTDRQAGKVVVEIGIGKLVQVLNHVPILVIHRDVRAVSRRLSGQRLPSHDARQLFNLPASKDCFDNRWKGQIGFAQENVVDLGKLPEQFGSHLPFTRGAAEDHLDFGPQLFDLPGQTDRRHGLLERGGEAHHRIRRPVNIRHALIEERFDMFGRRFVILPVVGSHVAVGRQQDIAEITMVGRKLSGEVMFGEEPLAAEDKREVISQPAVMIQADTFGEVEVEVAISNIPDVQPASRGGRGLATEVESMLTNRTRDMNIQYSIRVRRIFFRPIGATHEQPDLL